MKSMWNLFGMKNKKRCYECGCILEPDSELDICECCLDELLEGDSEVDE
jgi:hypothetical protein